jgi:hypothetical protein
VNFEVVEIEECSGHEAKIYSIVILDNNEEGLSLYDRFLEENEGDYLEEIEDIEDALSTMGRKTGLSSNRIIPFEGEDYGDGIVAICNRPNKILRLYGIMYGDFLAVLGGGGPKPGPGPLANYPKLRDENDLIRRIKRTLDLAIEAGDLEIVDGRIESATDFIFNTEDYE